MIMAMVFLVGSVATSKEGIVGCEESTTCPCPKNMDPVCDAQGKVYSNHCIFDCVKSRCTGKEVLCGQDCFNEYSPLSEYMNIVETLCPDD